MTDQESFGAGLALALFVLMIVLLVLGGSFLLRLKKEGTAPRSPNAFSTSSLIVLILIAVSSAVALVSTFWPYLALFPALCFFVLGAQTLSDGDRLERDGGILILLDGLAWALFTWLQVNLLAWSRTVVGAIRIDLIITLPAMVFVTAMGWGIHRLLQNRTSVVAYDGRKPRH